MYIEKQVCNEDYSERLYELGVEQKSLYYHTHSKFGILPKQSIDFTGRPMSAFTCAELVQMNENTHGIEFSNKARLFYSGNSVDDDVFYYKSFADALAGKLLNSLKKGWVSVDTVNARLLS